MRHGASDDAREAADHEHRQEAECEEEERLEMELPFPDRRQPLKILMPVGTAINRVVIIIGTRSHDAMNRRDIQTEKPRTTIAISAAPSAGSRRSASG